MSGKFSIGFKIGLIACLCTGRLTICLPQLNFENPAAIDRDYGMPSLRINTLVQDHLGFIWMGTEAGLCRFDGAFTQVFQHNDQDSTSIGSGHILHLLADSVAGKLWISTIEELSVYDYKTGAFENFPHVPGNPSSPPDYYPYATYRDQDGQIWVSYRERGLYRFRPEKKAFEQVFCATGINNPSDPYCHSIYTMSADPRNDSIIWLASIGLVRFNRITGKADQYRLDHPDERLEKNANNLRCLIVPGNGKVYYGTWYEGVFVLDQTTGEISHFEPDCIPEDYTLQRDVVNSFYPKSDHEFWISSSRGMQLYDLDKDCIVQLWRNDLKRKKWYSVDLIDAENRIWGRSPHYGALLYNPIARQAKISYYTSPDDPLMNITRKILEDTVRKRLYALPQGGRGLYVQDQATGKWSLIPPLDYVNKDSSGFAGWDMTFLENGELFIVENSRFYWYQPGASFLKPFHMQTPKGNPRLRKVQKDSQGFLWVTGYGWPIQRLDLRRKTICTFDAELKETWKGNLGADHIEEDKNGNIWMRENNGLLVYKRLENRFVYLPYETGSTKAYRGMGHIEAAPDGSIWVATNHESVGYAHADSIERGIFHHFSGRDGLIGDEVYMVKLIDDQLLVFTGSAVQWLDTRTKKFGDHFYLGYGLGGYELAATRLKSGELAIGKRKAVAFLRPEKLVINREIPRPYLTSFKVFDKEWRMGDKAFGRQDSLFLSHRQNFFSFEFSAVGFNFPKDIRYFYKLEGFDPGWQDGTKRKFASYTNVPGGEYHFLIKTVNNEGMSAARPFSMYLHISTVWWKTWWFWTLTGFALLGLAAAGYHYRIKQVRKEERLKSEFERKLADTELTALRAQMNPHFIFNSLNSIEYYIINNEPEKASDYLNRFSRLIRLILQNSKNTVVPLKDDLEALRLYMEIESLRFDNLFSYAVRVEKNLDLERYQIPPMLLQPYVENAIWHGLMQKEGEKGKLELLLRRENGHLICIIEDNGIGREAAQQIRSKSGAHRKSFGMKITGDRLALLNKISRANASVTVFDLKDDHGAPIGTRVELVIPV